MTPEKDQIITEMIRESLRDWFKKEKWVRINTSGEITGPCGTMKKGKATTRCLPKAKAQSLTKKERAATARKKARGSRKGKQFVSNTKKAGPGTILVGALSVNVSTAGDVSRKVL